VAGGVIGDIEMQDSPAIMTDDKEAIQHAERDCGHGEEVHGCNRLSVIAQEGEPALGWLGVSWRMAHPARNCAFRDIEAQHEKLTVNSRRAPGWVLCDHAKDQIVYLSGNALSAHGSSGSGDPSPVYLEPGSVPASHCFRSHDDESLLPGRPKSASRDPEDTINQTESCSGMLALQDSELLTESQIFEEQGAANVEKPDEDRKKDQNEIEHGVLL
jgi:hypothetical protein